MAGGIVAFVALRGSPLRTPPELKLPTLAPRTVSELGEMGAHPEVLARSTFLADPSGMVGTFASFDVLGNVGFATAIARAWSPDAKLVHLDAAGVREDGTDDVSDQPPAAAHEVGYFFSSRGRHAMRVADELSVHLLGGKVRVDFATTAGDPSSPPSTACTIPGVLAAARGAGVDRSAEYKISLRPWLNEKLYWEWDVSGSGGLGVHVCADSCAIATHAAKMPNCPSP